MRTILCLIQPWDTGTNARLNLYVGDSPTPIGFGLNATEWEAAFTARPQLTVELMDVQMSGKVLAGKASFTIQLRNIANVPNIVQKDFQGAPVQIWSADDLSWGRRRLEFTGFVTSATLDPDNLTVALQCDTSTAMLKVPLLWDEFTGAGGIGGDPSLRGTFKPAGFGAVPGVEPVWFDTINNVGMLDGYGNLLGVTRLLEGANAWGAKVGDYATYALLVAAIAAGTVGPGQWGTCIAQGLVGLGAPPQGVIMCDCTFGFGTPGTIIPRVLEEHAAVPADQIDLVAMAAVDAAVQALLGGDAPALHYWTKDQRQVDDLLGAVAGSANSTLLVSPQGLITISRAVTTASVGTLNRNGSVDPRVLNWKSAGSVAPFYLLRARAARPARVLTVDEVNFYTTIQPQGNYDPTVTYRPGNTVYMPDGSQWLYNDTAAAGAGVSPPTDGSDSNATWTRITDPTSYADGTPIDALRPTEVGANKTETHTSAAIAGQGVLATANAAKLGSTVVQSNGTTVVTDSTAITSLGTAAAIAGQGTLATANSVDLSTTQVTNKSLANVDFTAATKLNTIDTGATIGDNYVPNSSSLGGFAFVNLTPAAGGATDPIPNLGTQTAVGAIATLTSVTFTMPSSGSSLYAGGWAKAGVSGQHFQILVDWFAGGGAFLSSVTLDFFPVGTGWSWCESVVARPTTAVAAAVQMTVAAGTVAAKMGGPRLSASQIGATVGGQLGTNIVQSNGTTLVTDSTAITSLGTAAAIAGQGTLATANRVLFGSGALAGSVFGSNGTTAITDQNAITSNGTAAAIAGQGALATANSVDLTTAQVTNKSLANVDAAAATKLGTVAAGAGTSLSLTVTAGTPTVAGNSITFTAAGQTVVSQILKGPCRCTFKKLNAPNVTMTDGAANTLSLFLYSGQVRTFLNGVQAVGAYTGGLTGSETFWIQYDGVNWSTGWDGTLQYSVAATAGTTMQITAAYFAAGDQVIDLQFYASYLLPRSGSTLQKSDGTTLTDSLIVTSLGTAAAILAQGSYATLSQTYFGDGLLKETSGGATATLANFKTPIGTAAAIAGQGALATLGAVDLTTTQVSNKSLANLDSTANTKLSGIQALADVTSSHTAAAIASQGSLATLNSVDLTTTQVANKSLANLDATASTKLTGIATGATVGADINAVNLIDSSVSSTPLARSVVLTSLGTASAIAGQGSLATANSVAYGTSAATGFGTLAARGYVYFGSAFLTEDSGGATQATLTNFKTSSGTAAAIAGQGALATLGAVDLTTAQVTNKSLANLDSTANTKLSGIQALADVTSAHTAAAITAQGALATVSSADFATQVGGTTKPENNATLADNRIRNSNMVNTAADTWWGTATRTAGVAANSDPLFYARITAAGGGGGAFNGSVNIPVVGGETMYCSGIVRSATSASNNIWRFNPFFYDASGAFVSQLFSSLICDTTIWAVRKTSFTVPLSAATMVLEIAGFANTGASVDLAMPRVAATEYLATVGADINSVNLIDSSVGSSALSRSVLLTSLGTAAAIAGQGALATLGAVDLTTAQVTNKSLANLDSTASTKLSGIQALADVTSSHTASAITSQGALATANAVDLAGSTVLNKVAANIAWAAGGTVESLKPAEVGANVTSTHTAAAVAGQGTGATANSLAQLNASDGTKLSGISTGADVTINSQIVVPSPPPAATININSDATIASGQLPYVFAMPVVTKGGAVISASGTVAGDNLLTYTVTNVSTPLGTVTVDNTSGSVTKGQVTLANTPTAFTGGGTFQWNVFYNGIAVSSWTVPVAIHQAAPAGGTTTSGTTGSINQTVSGSTYQQVGSIVTLTLGAGKNLHGSFGGEYWATGTNKVGTATMKLRYAPTTTTTYTDFGTPVAGSQANSLTGTNGSISLSMSPSSPPSAGTYDCSLWVSCSGSGPLTFDGSVCTIWAS